MAKKAGPPTKSEILATISKDTELSRKQVSAVFDSLHAIIRKSLRGHGLVTLPGLLKLKVVKKAATKAKEGINPFTGEKQMFKAKPARNVVKILPLSPTMTPTVPFVANPYMTSADGMPANQVVSQPPPLVR